MLLNAEQKTCQTYSVKEYVLIGDIPGYPYPLYDG